MRCRAPVRAGDHETADLHRRTRLRHASERLAQEAADRIDVLVLELEIEQLADLVQPETGAHAESTVLERRDLIRSGVVLVRDVADQLLDDVLEGHEPRHTAVLIDDHAHVHTVALHLLQERLGLHRLRHEHGAAGDARHRGVAPAGLVAEAELHEVLQVQHPHDVVGVVVHERNARHAAVEEDRHRVARGRVGVDGHHVGARHHEFAHVSVGEVEDGVDELAIVFFDEVARGRLVHHAEQLLFGGERRTAGHTGGHPVAEEHETVREGTEHDPHAAHDRRCPAQEAPGVLPAEVPGARTDHDEGDARHKHGRRERRPEEVLEQEGERDGHQHRRGRVHDDADEGDGGGMRVRVGCDAPERDGAATVFAELLEVGAGGDAQGGVDGGHEPAERQQQNRRDEKECLGHARRRRSAAWNDAMRSRCRPNISRSSSGSA